ncbi:MAG: hypothetical protein PVF17_03595 [Ignavibacteria bacterium]|jgi:hypothetical protein
MSELKAKDLIQAKVLGCLDADEETLFNKMMKEDQDFPWEEFGQYQNLAACLPTMLDVETPVREVKDNIAMKLTKLNEKNKADEIIEEEPEVLEEKTQEFIETVDEESIQIEGENIEQEVDSGLLTDDTNNDITFKQHELLPDTLKNKASRTPETTVQPEDKLISKTDSTSPKEDSKRRNVKSHISKSPAYIEPPAQVDNKKQIMAAIILGVIAIILIILIYFSLSSDIQNNKDEIEKLKEQLHSSNAIENIYLNI